MKKPTIFATFFLLVGFTLAFAEDFEEKLNQFDKTLFELRKTSRISGLSAGIVQEGKLVWSGFYGFADADQTIPVTVDTPYWIASVTKTFVGLLFLQLEEEGKINLADRINDVPGWMDFCSWLSGSGIVFGQDLRCDARITIENILHHTSNGTPGTRFFLQSNIVFKTVTIPGTQVRKIC